MRIALVSDYFYPAFGGVESHIIGLANVLKRKGHHVIVITHQYEQADGTRLVGKRNILIGPLGTVIDDGDKEDGSVTIATYYIPMAVLYAKCIFPCLLPTYRFVPDILDAERIDIVHGHQSMSALCIDTLWIGKSMGIKTVLTDHSLKGFADAGSIVTNKLLEGTLCDQLTLVICVSYCSAANTVIRSNIAPELVFAIPNGISASFDPSLVPLPPRNNRIKVVISCRLEYRRGVDLLLGIIPRICQMYHQVDFIIIGDGPYRLKLEELKERLCLEDDRVDIRGMVPHSRVASVLNEADIFLNTALTEAFCIAIVEAARMGLLVVSTDVGGVPEVLPPQLVTLAKPEVDDLCSKLSQRIDALERGTSMPRSQISALAMQRYNWGEIGDRTIAIYHRALSIPPKSFAQRFNDFGVVTFNGRFYQALLILQVLIGFTRSHSIAFETCFYSCVALFAAIIVCIKNNEN